jgi:ADP-heptose:LPS heptosyltransferase
MTRVGRIEAALGRSPERILVLRALVIGDMLCAIPALRALRHKYPQANVTLVGLPWAKDFVARFNAYLDDFIEFPGFPGLPERTFDVAAFPGFLAEVQQRQFDVAIQMHGSGSFVNPLCELFGACVTAGFYVPGEYCPNATFFEYPQDTQEVQRHLQLMEFLGAPSCGEQLEFPLVEGDYGALYSVPEAAELQDQAYVCIHPGARFLSRRWHPERYAQAADRLAAEGYRIVVTGTGPEAEVASAVVNHMRAPAINLATKTTLGALAVLLKGARLLISNDTGVSHVAAALRVPSVVVVTGSDPQRWAPLDGARHQTVIGPVDCRPCEHVICPIGFPCADAVRVDDVVARALAMLETFSTPALAG